MAVPDQTSRSHGFSTSGSYQQSTKSGQVQPGHLPPGQAWASSRKGTRQAMACEVSGHVLVAPGIAPPCSTWPGPCSLPAPTVRSARGALQISGGLAPHSSGLSAAPQSHCNHGHKSPLPVETHFIQKCQTQDPKYFSQMHRQRGRRGIPATRSPTH